MFDEPELFWLGVILWLGLTVLLLAQWGAKSKAESEAPLPEAENEPTDALRSEIEELQGQCRHLRDELQQQSSVLRDDFRAETFAQLQSLLVSYPTARCMARSKPSWPAKNLVSLFSSLEQLIQSWDYDYIGQVWEQVPYDPQLHQPDAEDIAPGELVYIRFVGYRDGDRIFCPAKVSRTLPNSHP
ncbi:MAG: molecular chaperone GrpE [Cyanobacteriota bacterium]|nr:molecular chaperone GrpE [Cyanobacteriota bacterium]